LIASLGLVESEPRVPINASGTDLAPNPSFGHAANTACGVSAAALAINAPLSMVLRFMFIMRELLDMVEIKNNAVI
jgi:hypothetical protein